MVRVGLALAATVVAVVLVAASAQQPTRQQQQQQFLRRQQQQQQFIRQQQQQQQQASGGNVPAKPDYNKHITKFTPELLATFLRREQDVATLTNCFERFNECQAPNSINLITQIRELGRGGSCAQCSPQQQQQLGLMIRNFIGGLRQQYPSYFERIKQYLIPLLPSGSSSASSGQQNRRPQSQQRRPVQQQG